MVLRVEMVVVKLKVLRKVEGLTEKERGGEERV